MIDLNDSGFRLTFGAEEEFSALGGIPYDQIEAWIPMANADLKTKMTKADGLKFHDFETFSAEYPAKKWTVNPDYNHQKYDLLAASPGQPQLAGDDKNLAKYSDKTLEKYAIEFMEKNGAAVGWAGKFPLSFLNTPASSSEPAASAPAQTPSTQAPSTQNPSTQTPSTAKPNFWELEAKLCATGPDGKGKHGLDKNQCHREVSQCAFEAHKSPDSNWDTVIKCMDTKFLPAAH
ncbi:hypothetical protein BM221_010810 [Beauveria bassiana]|uniref:Uncharacterized protein n=1 Tax=Beauveria bassiana TaxID=176275 RepID=A0A2N6N7U1_BEABA|nr:hypothetical protein BM221_010810 [Beauveria bassiana]